jgi:hypothetical protein
MNSLAHFDGGVRVPKQRSPKKCLNCKKEVQFTPFQDIATCVCGNQFLTGYDKRLRKVVEADCSSRLDLPRLTIGRALGYSSAIYGVATHDEAFDPSKVEQHFKSQSKFQHRQTGRYSDGATGEASVVYEGGRGLRLRNLNDNHTGYLIVVVKADRASRARGRDFHQIFIVFRGSRSGTGAKNPMDAGFTQDGTHWNVDYAANLSGKQERPWWCRHVKVRRGFLELYKSMSIEITQELDRQLAAYPDARVIVTGHSLGAGVAVVCAHHLQYHRGQNIAGGGPACYPFCTPRVGDLAFAQDFKNKIGAARIDFPGEPSGTPTQYSRSINFCMNNDPVSWWGDKGYQHDGSDDLRSRGTPMANSGMARQVGYVKVQKTINHEIIFYQTPNVYAVGWQTPSNIHQFTKMQEILLGRALYTT